MITKFNKQIIKNYEFKGILVLWFLKNETVSGLQLNNYYDDFVKGTKYKRIYKNITLRTDGKQVIMNQCFCINIFYLCFNYAYTITYKNKIL